MPVFDSSLPPVPDTPEGRVAAAYAYESKVNGGRTFDSSVEPPAPPSIRQPSTSTRGLGHESGTTSQAGRGRDRSCPASLTRHDEGSRRDGCCTWCGQKFKGKAPRPNLATGYPTDLEREYRRAYDPDYGVDHWDS
jgi:hypothetical protein